MKPSIIKVSSFLGPFHHQSKLKVGETQFMYFRESDTGPFYLTEKERQERQNDNLIGTKKINLTIPQLVSVLKEKGVRDPKGSKDKLQKMCIKNNISITHKVPNIVKGWRNKQKGSFQLLYDRG